VILLDTHAWIWAVADPRQLSAAARRRIAAEPSVGVSAISTWEVAMLVAKARLRLDRDVLTWLRDALARRPMTLLPLTPEVAVASTALTLHGDPSDRIIVATALEHGADLVTADVALRKARIVRCVW